MIKSTLNGQPLNIATSWEELTYAQFLRVSKIKGSDLPEIISIMTGIDKDTVLKANIKGLDQIIAVVQFLETPPTWEAFGDKVGPFNLPLSSDGKFEIQFETLAQFEDMRAELKKIEKGLTADILMETLGLFVAIYLQKVRDGEYDYDKAVLMAKTELPNYPAQEVVGVGTFFLIKVKTLLTGIIPNYPPTTQSQAKNIGKGTKKRSVRIQRLTKSRGR